MTLKDSVYARILDGAYSFILDHVSYIIERTEHPLVREAVLYGVRVPLRNSIFYSVRDSAHFVICDLMDKYDT